jgi:molybdopterin-guanine dinucleotide biosynthesis protein A
VTIKKHKKHPAIQRPSRGEYGRNEIGLLGAPCDVILKWVEAISSELPEYKFTYIDADHHATPAGSIRRLTDKITHHQLTLTKRLNKYDQHLLLDQEDLVIINCNHFNASKQVVFCTLKKKESLGRKLDKLTDVQLVILEEGIAEPFEFLQPYLKANIPIIRIENIDSAKKAIKSFIATPEVKGLILAGGRSTRMGEDKGTINYHGISQVDFLQETYKKLGIEAFVSCREDQSDQYSSRAIYDSFLNMGPFGAILSAFKQYPDNAWIVTACDMPLIGLGHFEELIENRDISKGATCFYNPATGWPDPLFTLWEPKAYARLLEFMSLGYNCPRKVLINSDVNVIHREDTEFLINANSPKEKDAVLGKIKGI